MSLLDLQAQFQPIRPEVMTAIARVCDAQRFIMGEEVESFEPNIPVVEDAAQAIGAAYRGAPVGGFGEMGASHYFPRKTSARSATPVF